MSVRNTGRGLILVFGLALCAVPAIAGEGAVIDPARDGPGLKAKPYLDITRATAGVAGERFKHKVTMAGEVKPGQENTRPFLLINTHGGDSSKYEYIVIGRRVFRVRGEDKFIKSGAAEFAARKRTWVYRFKPRAIGNPRSYGWAALTSKGSTMDLAPDEHYEIHRP